MYITINFIINNYKIIKFQYEKDAIMNFSLYPNITIIKLIIIIMIAKQIQLMTPYYTVTSDISSIE